MPLDGSPARAHGPPTPGARCRIVTAWRRNGLDALREEPEPPTIVHINKEPPPEVVELMDEPSELEGGSG